jgi:chromate transporter
MLTETTSPAYSLWQLIRYFLRLGTLGFGGPIALVGYMRRDLVEKEGWINESDYKEGLALAQLAPGPLAAQLAIYLGYVHYKVRGATLVGIAFVLPSFLMVLAMGWAYQHYHGIPAMQSVFYGVGACVIGIIAHSAYKLTRRSLGKDKLLWGIYLVSAIATIVTETEDLRLFLLAGILTWFVKAPPAFLKREQLAGLGFISATEAKTLEQIFFFFTKAGAFVFGSGLAIVPFLYGGVVKEYGWLSESQFVDAVAVAMITPGPVVITVGFIGYLVAGVPGATTAAFATFLPCYLFTILPAPYFKKYGKRPDLAAFVEGITTAAIGAISGAVVVLAQRAISDIPTALIAIFTALILWKTKRIPEPILVLCAAILGLVLKGV